jgi:uncharacterized membrane protein YbhN (UPF0104 family)
MSSDVPREAVKTKKRRGAGRIALALIGIAFVVATFVFFLPKIADYREVWEVVKGLTWPWIVALLAVEVFNILTFAPPWQVALPGLRFLPALAMTQVSTALSLVVPGGAAVGIAGSYGMLRSRGFAGRDVGRAVTLTGLWSQFANLLYPIVALFLLTTQGGRSPALATAAFIGVAVLGVVVAGLVLVLVSDRMASDLGDVAARLTNRVLRKLRRGPVGWGGESFESFRDEAGDLLVRRWHLLTLTTFVGSLSVFAVLLVSLRALDVPATEVSGVEAFAAWALVRLIASVPLTPGGIGVVELGLTGALVGFGGNNAGVVAAVLVFRFLTIVPTLVLGLLGAATWRRHHASRLTRSESPG